MNRSDNEHSKRTHISTIQFEYIHFMVENHISNVLKKDYKLSIL